MESLETLTKKEIELIILRGERLALENFVMRLNAGWFAYVLIMSLWTWIAYRFQLNGASFSFTLAFVFGVIGIGREFRRRQKLSEVKRKIRELRQSI